jgi:DNA-binding response OmpR family regulator
MKRKLVLMLADAGYDVRAFTAGDPALETARNEWFDLALIDARMPGASEFEFVESLKKIQPTVPVIFVVQQLELPLIVKGIRMGLSDVLPTGGDLRPLLRRVNSILRPNQTPAAEDHALTPSELAEAEAVLQVLANPDIGQSNDPFNTPDFRQELLRGAKERAMLEQKAERLDHEKLALEAELKTLLSQNADALRLQGDLDELRTQRDTAASAQSVIDHKARALAEARSELARERTALEEERRKLAQSTQSVSPFAKSADEIARERTELETQRAKLAAAEAQLHEEETRIQREGTQIAQERRRWHEDLDLIREQETNLREYEARLRQLQAQLEADRVLWFSSRPQSRSPFQDDAAVKATREKHTSATDLLEAERAIFRDERMAFREQEGEFKRREAQLEELSAKLDNQEKRLRGLPPAPLAPLPFIGSPIPNPAQPSGAKTSMKTISRAPFEMAKSLLGRNKPHHDDL